MTLVNPLGRVVRPILFGGLVGLVLVLGGPAAPASAHANLLSSDPPNGATLNEPPTEITLTFSEPVRLMPDRIAVVKPDGAPLPIGEPTTEGTDVLIPVEEEYDIGTYLVSYRVISQDSHPVAGAITYSVGAPSEVPELDEAQADVSDRTVTVAVSANKYVGYAGLVLLIGPALALALLWPRRLPRRGITRLLWTGAGLVAVSTLAGLWLQAPYTTGESLFGASGAALQDVASSTFGTAHIVRLGVLVSVLLLLRPLLAGRAGRADLYLLGGLGVVGLGTWPVAGHAIASPLPAVSLVADVAHLAAAAVWIGGLVVLVGFLLRQASERELGVILPEWSRWAALAVAVLLLAGLVQGVVEIGPPDALVTTTYGRLLLLKVGLVVLVVAVASYSRRMVRERIAASRPRPLRRAVAIEAAVLAGVLAISSALVQTTPGRTAVTETESVAITDFNATLEDELFSLQLLVEPAEVGSNTVHLYASEPDTGDPLRVEEWTATAALPSAGVEPIEIPVLPLTDDHATGEVATPVAGDWEFKVTLRISEIEQGSVEATVPIS